MLQVKRVTDGVTLCVKARPQFFDAVAFHKWGTQIWP